MIPKPKPVCVVLSVGGENGVAHIGVLEALKSEGIEPQCVFGNSMGALIGGLYAADPQRDLREHYRALMGAYVNKTKSDAEGAGGLGFLALAGLTIVTGGTAGAALLAGAAGAGLGVASINELDRDRLVGVLGRDFEEKTISELPVQFATWHSQLRSEVVQVTVTSGSLAEAIGDSVANPLVFPAVKVERGARIDPGSDRVSAVPLEDACRLRPDAHFIVSNVTTKPLYFSSAMKCSYQEIHIIPPKVEPRNAFMGVGSDFDRMLEAGFVATGDALRATAPGQSHRAHEDP